ncbi:3-ketoacyl-CoA synthase 20-like [Camellia sinensis]|uniref:3-ketoacyl-CoA synthase 20-like n=1 Tax=Camellia sinensis TaxID=4442 RepID=UPI001036719B|nr:3-ketoacyl-CoA synthase 20-like [Camellia sinensis]
MAAQTVGNVVALMPIPVANVSEEAMQAVMSMRRDELAKLEVDKVFQAFLSPTLDDKFFNGVRHVGQVHQNSYALVVSTENLTQNCYMGNDHSKLLINCAFRIGGAAILLSNRPLDRHSSKYQLIHTVQTHMASSDRSYNCIFQEEDQDGLVGVTVTKDLLVTASKAIQSNISTLGPLVLPVSEQLLYFVNYIIRSLHVAKIQPYVPNLKKSFNHFLPHVGAKPVLDELQRSLKLTEDDMEASRMTLYRFGNTSSSTVWYELAYVEAKGRIKYGDQVWHMAFGSGFKCTSVVWRAIRTVDLEVMNPWNDEIDEFPMDLNNIAPFNNFFERTN